MTTDPVALGLPHREPFQFVDAVIEHHPGVSATCIKSFPASDPVFRGHFPGNPIVPGVLLTEALAQTAGIAAAVQSGPLLLSAIRGMKFFGAVRPDEPLTLRATVVKTVGPLWQFDVSAECAGKKVADGQVVLSEGAQP